MSRKYILSLYFLCVLIIKYNKPVLTLPVEKPINSRVIREIDPVNSGLPEDESEQTTISSGEEITAEQVLLMKEKLRQVFELDDAILWKNEPGNHQMAPEYMVDLYQQTADIQSGLTKAGKPYNATLVRSFHNKGLENEKHFWFDVGKMKAPQKNFDEDSSQQKSPTMQGAEFHIYKHVKKTSNDTGEKKETDNHKFIEMRLYSISFKTGVQTFELLESRPVNSHGSGWEIFHVHNPVQYWIDNPHDNFGLYIALKGLDGKDVDEDSIEMEIVTQAKSKHSPLLVLFCQEGTHKKQFAEYKQADSLMESVPEKKDFISRNRRSPGQTSTQAENTDITTQGRDQKLRNRMVGDQPMWSQRRNCERLPLYVDFFEIGWSGWIISPSGYNAYYCQGECPFPLGQMHRPSNHATVQSIVNAIGPKLESGAKIPQPCCVPDKLYSISLLYFDDSGDVILKQYDDMVAASCGCH